MTSTAPHRSIAALLGALLVVTLPGSSAHASATDDPQDDQKDPSGVTLHGDEVRGGSNWGDAVELSTEGQYLDEFTDDTLHYRIPREIDDSTIHVGVTTFGQDGEGDSVQIELGTWDGEPCASSSISTSASGYRDHLRSTHIGTVTGMDVLEQDEDPCRSADEIIMSIELDADPDEARSIGEPLEILVYEEPPPTNLDDLPEAYDDMGEWVDIGRNIAGALEIAPGTSFDDAPVLDPGNTYDVELRPGQIQFFRVPLDWGQHLQAEAHFPEPSEQLSRELERMGQVSLMVVNPMRAALDSSAGSPSSRSTSQYRVRHEPIRWFNREWSFSTLAGEHILVVAADEHETGADFLMDYHLTMDTFGEAGEGAPEYPAEHENSQPGFSGGDGWWEGSTGSQGIVSAIERIRGLGENAAAVGALATFGLLMFATGSLVLVRTLRRGERR